MPRSTLYPMLGMDMINGLKLSIQQQSVSGDIELIIDNIGFGINEPEIYAKAEKMLLQENADVVIAFADTIIAELLQPLFTATNKILLIVNFGANFPRSWNPEPTCITLSLNFCLQARLTGKLAASKENKKAANVLSYFDGGYNQCYSLINSFQVNGGITMFNHVTHFRLDQFSLKPLDDFLEQHADVSTLLCLFAGEQAGRFYTDIEALQQKRSLDLFVSPMMLDETIFSTANYKTQQVQGFVPWHSTLTNQANQDFKTIIKSKANKQANYFLLLGWEAGMLLSEIFRRSNDHSGSAEIIQAVKKLKYNSPRGWLKIDEATHHCYAPCWHAKASGNDITIIEEVNDIEKEWQEFTQEPLLTEYSMWRNTYLCI